MSISLAGVGCSDIDPEPPTVAAEPAQVLSLDPLSVAAVAPPPGTPAELKEPEPEAPESTGMKYAPLSAESLLALNEAVALYGTDEEGRKVKIPKDVEQLVQEKYLMFMPVPPKGQKLIINQKTGLIEIVAAR